MNDNDNDNEWIITNNDKWMIMNEWMNDNEWMNEW